MSGSVESYHVTSMIEGWASDDYLMLLSTDEAKAASERYGIADLLPGYRIIGLRGWDDFIVEGQNGDSFTLPTVPCEAGELARHHVPACDKLIADDRFTGRVKWYITPVKFGGDPAARENLTWISLLQHADAVRWWNALYRDVARKKPTSRRLRDAVRFHDDSGRHSVRLTAPEYNRARLRRGKREHTHLPSKLPREEIVLSQFLGISDDCVGGLSETLAYALTYA